MKTVDLPIEQMHPRIFTARPFEYPEQQGAKGARRSFLYELGFYLGGNGTITIGDNVYDIHFGDIRFVKPGTYLNSTPEYRCYTVMFDFGENNTVYKNQILDNIPEYFSTTGELAGDFEAIMKSEHSSEVHGKLRSVTLLMQLLSTIFEMFYSKKKYSDSVRSMIAYMEENFQNAITLENLGELSGYSDIHTMRLFRSETGQTPHEWLTAIRINHAKELLAMSDKTIEQIASECGFNSDSHFKILFKKMAGMTPGRYRKNASEVY